MKIEIIKEIIKKASSNEKFSVLTNLTNGSSEIFRTGITLDKNFMESVWNVFSKLHKKGLIYKGSKIMPYSTGCTTPLSNFEAN